MGSSNSLPALEANPLYTSVIGFSGGSYMATNLHVIYSDTIKGVGLLSGGPYYGGFFYKDAGQKYTWDFTPESFSEQCIAGAEKMESEELIDPLSNLSGSPVYI